MHHNHGNHGGGGHDGHGGHGEHDGHGGHDGHGRHGGPPGRKAGPEGTDFLDLEISKVILGEAESMTRQVYGELLREAIRERLRERLGDQITAVGRLAADILADDIEANLGIERLIEQRKGERREVDSRLRAIFGKGEKA
jgi:hypothetical protein